MTKTYCDICGNETERDKCWDFEFALGTDSFSGYRQIEIPLDVCSDCKNSSKLLKDVWDRNDFEGQEFRDLLKEKFINMIKEK